MAMPFDAAEFFEIEYGLFIGSKHYWISIMRAEAMPGVPQFAGFDEDGDLYISHAVPLRWRKPRLAFLLEYVRLVTAGDDEPAINAFRYEMRVFEELRPSDQERAEYLVARRDHTERVIVWHVQEKIVNPHIEELQLLLNHLSLRAYAH